MSLAKFSVKQPVLVNMAFIIVIIVGLFLMFTMPREIFPSISFDTVNRTLLTFAEAGIVGVVEGFGEPRRFDPNLDLHHHFHCVGCGEIVDFESPELDRLKVPKLVHERFTVLSKRVVLNGLCSTCARGK